MLLIIFLMRILVFTTPGIFIMISEFDCHPIFWQIARMTLGTTKLTAMEKN